MHVLPQLRKLEQMFPKELVAVGVHSPKFPGEQPTRNLRQAVLRLEIEHPVVNDPKMRLWSEYAVGAWPTLMFVDPAGNVIGKHAGEFDLAKFRPLVEAMLAEFDAKGMLDRRPLAFQPEQPPDTPLLFPGKLLADEASGRLFIADSGHDRIVVATLDGQVQQVIGGRKGLLDGGPREAAFDKPQGLALDGTQLYVADSWNHAVRRIDLATGQVTTVAGTGEQALRVREGPALATTLNSPWALAFRGGTLYIAMAGSHQIWAFDPRSGNLSRYSGTGREALTDGTLSRATFAQPSGLSAGDGELYVADSEASAVRAADLPGGAGQLRTLVGQGLFDFGDVDGRGAGVRLQHALDACFDPTPPSPLPWGQGQGGGVLYVADSYNHKIKRLDPRTDECLTLLGSGDADLRDGAGIQASFWEPSGLSLAGGKLYVADTNNHSVRVADLKTLRVTTLRITGLP